MQQPLSAASIRLCSLFTVLFALYAVPVFAWNALGHKVVAEIAWRKLSPEQRQSIVDTLRRHPRFDKDFAGKMTDDVLWADTANQNRWIFQHAATWPDIARNIKGDDRMVWDWPTWHYVNFPHYLNPSEGDALAPTLTFNQLPEYPTTIAKEDYNAMQAVEYCRSVLNSRAGPDQKAIAYCWLLHLAGDIHQPLHSTALVSANHFPLGDRGGNEINLVRGRNLHDLWDNLLGRSHYLSDVDRTVAELADDRYCVAWNVARESNVNTWAHESHELCKTCVYSSDILDAVRNTPPGDKVAPIALPELYMQTAGDQAREQVIAAGLRLAVLLGAPANELTHWLNTKSNVRHNKSCEWYSKTKRGRYCTYNVGHPCGQCGG